MNDRVSATTHSHLNISFLLFLSIHLNFIYCYLQTSRSGKGLFLRRSVENNISIVLYTVTLRD